MQLLFCPVLFKFVVQYIKVTVGGCISSGICFNLWKSVGKFSTFNFQLNDTSPAPQQKKHKKGGRLYIEGGRLYAGGERFYTNKPPVFGNLTPTSISINN